MRKNSLNTSGFSLSEVLLFVVALVVIVGGGAYVYHQGRKTNALVSSSTSSKTSTSGKAATTTGPYAGWQSATLKYEQLTFKYPSSWQLSNTSQDEKATGGTVTPGSDKATLTSPTGLVVSINTGEAGIGDSDGLISVLSGARPISTLGGSYYLDFYTNVHGSTDAQGACLDKSTSATGMPYITAKNIKLANVSGSSAAPADLVCINYYDTNSQALNKPVTTFEQDASYYDAKLIIESLAY